MSGASFQKDLDFVEYFSGCGVLASSVSRHGLDVATFDKQNDALWEDLNTDEGSEVVLRDRARSCCTGG